MPLVWSQSVGGVGNDLSREAFHAIGIVEREGDRVGRVSDDSPISPVPTCCQPRLMYADSTHSPSHWPTVQRVLAVVLIREHIVGNAINVECRILDAVCIAT